MIYPFSPHAGWKRAVIRNFARRFDLKTFVETGTCWGDTVAEVQESFEQVYSIELGRKLHDSAKERFSGFEKIKLFYGDSAIVLPGLVKQIEDPRIMFWLDAHIAGPDTADNGDPLPVELKAVFESKPDSLILIDDIKPDYQQWDNMRILNDYPEWKQTFLKGILILQRGGYQIPEQF